MDVHLNVATTTTRNVLSRNRHTYFPARPSVFVPQHARSSGAEHQVELQEVVRTN